MRKRLLFLWAAAADLAIDGVLGVTWLTIMLSLLATGVSAVPAFGIGIGLLWLTVQLGRGIRFVERRRAEALYGVVIVPPPVRPAATTFGGWLAGTFVESFGATLWKGILHHLTTAVLGLLFLTLISGSIDLVGDLAAGRLGETASNPALVALAAVLAAAVLVAYTAGAGLLDRQLSVALLGASAKAALEQRVDRLQDARQGAVDSAQAERQRIERDLHDGVQPRLVSVAMTLGLARSKFADDPEGAKALLDEAHRETKESITELRHLARGIHPAVLTDRGLDAALSAVASHCTVPTSVRVDLPQRPSKETEAVLYFAVSEALANASKHSRASGCSVSVTATPTAVRAVVFDNGVGGAALGRGGGTGLSGMADRVRAAGGTLTVDSPTGGPTVLTVEVPCAF
ncbi:histidine kinase [Herbiconiux sp. VKM Ac-2851]|uniref:sensor histidine kinase n=1 Tax=Herbiconiux sp. VKM Ac-2851 TaxID=2739025 RepID=UPI0015669479|nr:sensor domain-containing protein [Herbiconiux sp. VKM Ac-2851]